jgi:hypothetical protein
VWWHLCMHQSTGGRPAWRVSNKNVPISETPPTCRTSSPYLYPLGTGWPSYTPGHWVPFPSPRTTRRAVRRHIHEVEVTLRLTVSQSVRLGVDPTLGLVTRYYFLSGFCLKTAVLFLWGALSDERTGLQFAVRSLNGPSRAEPVTLLYCLIWDSPKLEGRVPVFIPPRYRVAQLCPGHWVPFTSSLTTRRATVEVF